RFVEVGVREICSSGIGVRQSSFGIVIPSARSTTTLLRKVGFIDIVGHDVYRDFFVAINLIQVSMYAKFAIPSQASVCFAELALSPIWLGDDVDDFASATVVEARKLCLFTFLLDKLQIGR